MALMVGQIQALITADKGQYSSTVKAADAERRDFIAGSKKDKAVIDGDEKPLERATQRSVRLVGSMRAKIGGFMGEIRGEFLKVGAVAGIIGGLRSVVMAASDLNESANAINVTFAGAEKKVFEFTATAARTIGQSNTQAREAVATFGTYGKQAGLAAEQNAAFSISLAKLASDLASFKNTTPEEAIEALGAALRGESDPIEKYGVLLNESVIQQRALKMGVIATTSQALTPQQRVLVAYQEILAQTKDAQGDFGRTSGELANQLRTLKARLVDQAAALGQDLLPAAKNVVSFLSGPGVAALGAVGVLIKAGVSAVGQLAQAWQGIPGPLQAAILAMVAWRLVQGRVEEGFGSIRDKVQGMTSAVAENGSVLGALRSRFAVVDDMANAYTRASNSATNWGRAQTALAVGLGGVNEQMSATQRATVMAGDGLSRVAGIASGVAAAGFAGVKAAASGLVSFLGGPWGVAFALAGVALSMWISRQQAAKQAAAEHASKVRQLTQDIQANGGAVSAQTKAQQVQEATSKHLYELASKLGVAQGTMTQAILGNKGAIDVVNKAFDSYGIRANEFAIDTSEGWKKVQDTFDGFAGTKSWGELSGALTRSRRDFGELSGQMIEASDAANDTGGKLAEVGVKAEDLAPKAAAAKAALTPMEEALKKMADAAATDTEKVDALKSALDELAGKKHTVEEAVQAVNDSLRDMGQAFKDAKADATDHKTSLLDASGAINTVTEKGSALQDKIMSLSDAYRQQFAAVEQAATASGKTLPEAMVAAAQATAATRQRFIETATAAGLTAQQAQNLAAKYDLLPTNVATQITQPGMMEGVLNALGLGKNIRNIPNQWQTVLSSTAPEQIKLMESLGFKVKTLPNGQILVTVDSAAAESALRRLTATDRKTIIVDLVASGVVQNLGAANRAVKQQATGGIMEFYAGGGIRPMSAGSAAIVGSYRRTGVLRMIADNPRVDEAFVPIDRYSARSQAILDDLLKRMRPEWFRGGGAVAPMGSGGIYGDGSAGGGQWRGNQYGDIHLHAVPSVPTVQQLRDVVHELEVLNAPA